jgi:hypothetical protein
MVLSLSPGPASVELAHSYRELANMWRITDDFWDRWDLLKDMFDRCERWYSWVGPESWPDCDMLPLGHIGIRSSEDGASNRESRFTPEEQQTMMSLWALFRSPLMLGCELRDLDPWTLALVTNQAVLAINQKGASPRPVTIGGTHRVWCSVSPKGSLSVGLFNLGDEAQQLEAGAQLGCALPELRVAARVLGRAVVAPPSAVTKASRSSLGRIKIFQQDTRQLKGHGLADGVDLVDVDLEPLSQGVDQGLHQPFGSRGPRRDAHRLHAL